MKNECERDVPQKEDLKFLKKVSHRSVENVVSKRQSRRSGGGHQKKKTRDSEEELEAGKAPFEVELYKKTGV